MANSHDFSNLDILLVGENRHMLNLVAALLTAQGTPFPRTAHGGEEALVQIVAAVPDLVITDWDMRPISGIDLVRKLRSESKSLCPTIPIIMLTGHNDASKIIAARDAGVTEFLTKPVSSETVYKRVVSVIEKPRAFIRSGSFFGPDRRRKNREFSGPDRRQIRLEHASDEQPPAKPDHACVA